MRIIFFLLVSALSLCAQLPDAYRTVSRLMWVVPDAERTAAAWAKAGVPTTPVREVSLTGAKWKGRSVDLGMRYTAALFENTIAILVQPSGEDGPFGEFLSKHGAGVLSLIHGFPDEPSMRAEQKRLETAGARALLEGTVQEREVGVPFVLFDTVAQGKYSLGLTVIPETPMPAGTRTRRVTQFAFVARDLEAVSRYWEKLGLPALTYSHPDMSELVYRGKPGNFDMRLGWQRHGKVVYEWIQPQRGPSTYEEHLKKHGEGLHHVAFNVDDMDAAIREWEGFGFPLAMGGAWGAKGKPGSGRFAYHDLDQPCGIEVELLWNFKTQ